jgi:hypothetical protein
MVDLSGFYGKRIPARAIIQWWEICRFWLDVRRKKLLLFGGWSSSDCGMRIKGFHSKTDELPQAYGVRN